MPRLLQPSKISVWNSFKKLSELYCKSVMIDNVQMYQRPASIIAVVDSQLSLWKVWVFIISLADVYISVKKKHSCRSVKNAELFCKFTLEEEALKTWKR